jgi:malate dehydrogenase (oxaloacetate-decarboxylating)(NADP+)
MYISLRHRGRIAQVLANWPAEEVDIIVISDGSRILVLGDLGANGMGIPIGKLVLYVAGAGLHPDRTLPILLDAGTNNEELLNDPLYLGCTHRRIRGEPFYEFVDEFVQAATARWPRVLIQWEDFTNDKAFPLLHRYRDDVLCFNDDIQGTGAVALAGLLAAMRIRKERLSDQRVAFCGAGSACVGIADTLCAGIAEERGMSVEAARQLMWMMDVNGLVTSQREAALDDHNRRYARDEAPTTSLLELVQRVRPTILIGACGQGQTFTKEVVQAMQQHCERPVIFALSNPTSKAECTAEQIYSWTDGKAIFASGSPFPAVRVGGRVFVPGQCNNMFVFPGVGLGAIACGATQVTDEMFFTAARTLAHMVTDEELRAGTIYPDLRNIRQISLAIASAVCRLAWDEGLAQYAEPPDVREYVRKCQYHPAYRPYVAV